MKRRKFKGSDGISGTFKTMTTSHDECMERLKAKQNWERMSRLGVLLNYSNIVCQQCWKEMDFQFINNKKD